MKNTLPMFLLTLVLASPGCESRRTNLIARTGSQSLRMELNKVSLMISLHRDSRARELDQQLALELRRRGIAIVPPTESDFTIAANSENNWDTNTRTVQPRTTWDYSMVRLHPGETVILPSSPDPPMVPVHEATQIQTEGIRLRIYETDAIRQGRFQTAWEGYIEAGLKLRPEQEPALLRTLCDYLGRDFIGHVKIPK